MQKNFYQLSEIERHRAQAGKPYLEFLRIPAMSAGVYVLGAGAVDAQLPHKEDEIYYVVRGKAHMRVGSESQPVGEGALIFVAAEVEHRFHDIMEDLLLLVFFAPAESA
jgi:mannose-6-phosphate isomerase-like protein (cupin superfamily)